jgi:ketosteroid isomerase-like protein
MVDRVAGVNSRDHIESVLRAYIDTWATGDTRARLALFADDIVIEDPATVRQASTKTELSEFVKVGIPSAWDITFSFDRVAVAGDEAVFTYRIALRAGYDAPAELLVNAHVEFGPDGLIHRFRTFFDSASITEHEPTTP